MASARSWTDRSAIVAELQRRWDRGEILAEIAGAASIFPYRIRMATPTTGELSSRYDDVRSWTRDLADIVGIRVETVTVGARTIGRNNVPVAIWVDSIDVAAVLLGRSDDVQRFAKIAAETRELIPELVPWLAAHPLIALPLVLQWHRLLAVVSWLQDNPEPGIYVRQVDIRGVDTKFIERHEKVITALFRAATETVATDSDSSFVARFGFRAAPQAIRVRSLDTALQIGFLGVDDRPLTLTIEDAARITAVKRVFITENYTNFLAFPPAAGSVVMFREGFDVGKLALLPWITTVPVYYWGDIDTHGFAILDLLRSRLPHVESMLMDDATLHEHELQWGTEAVQVRRDLANLTSAEQALYDDLRDNRFRLNLRFEQELTSFGLVARTVERLVNRTSPS